MEYNNFLGSSVNSSDIATETTLNKIKTTLDDGVDVSLEEINGNPIDTGVGYAGPGTLTTTLARDQPALNVHNPHLIWEAQHDIDNSAEKIEYNLISGGFGGLLHNAVTKTSDITFNTDTAGNLQIYSHKFFNVNGPKTTFYYTLVPNISAAGSHTSSEIVAVGFGDLPDVVGGFNVSLRILGDDGYAVRLAGTDGTIAASVPVGSNLFNINTNVEGPRNSPHTIYIEVSSDAMVVGEVYQGVHKPLHAFHADTPNPVWNCLTRGRPWIQIQTGSLFPSFVFKLVSWKAVTSYAPITSANKEFFTASLRNSGSTNAIQNYSGAATDFQYDSIEDDEEITALHVHILGSGNFSAVTYGSIARLTNGVQLVKKYADTSEDNLFDIQVRDNGEWGLYGEQVIVFTYGLNANDATRVCVKFRPPIRLNQNESLAIRLNDDFTGTVRHHFVLHGARDRTEVI